MDAEGAGPVPDTLKIVVAGGFGAGKTTLVSAVSEVESLHTEEVMTSESVGVDDLDGVEAKATTTVALDFGRITLDGSTVVYLFGTPGQRRFSFMWEELTEGALGAVVLADTRRLADSFDAIDFFESRGVPFVVAVNCFDGQRTHRADDVRVALDLEERVPLLLCDARDRESVKEVLVELVALVLRLELSGA
ncbi:MULTISPECIES: ATP/GTP-binding protein [Nocardiopsis]|jgi:signal recognition particle receptor subunit beta|uniref:ATP-binding protein n=2 Tax=Nocardiopsis TaxID=2013 RepID=A0A7X6MI36_9ACTN|nr:MULTISPECIES: ATP/GTP-binding protein [Nocardiopsis]APC38421.1 ATP-binding protein [Nocardiopsis dassonvillei]MCK9869013.1 ATP/GTP-binding protein [Nocardiopsis dassonvillei]NKZ02004.1 ATP-binding protein [Nocardiopsis alborubida]QUX31770.1 ATP/GTP-binding protein [Nocardiopsis akebiae]WDZ93927.1 ATP/GTP-binding protein [Nocardiopsis sp. HUAS JQ3]